jgi:hypothetical protein
MTEERAREIVMGPGDGQTLDTRRFWDLAELAAALKIVARRDTTD